MRFRVRVGVQLVLLLLICATSLRASAPDQVPPRDQAWHVLREGLTDAKVSRRKDAVQALSLIKRNRTAQRLAVHALSDAHPSVRTAAAATLGQLHATAAIPDLKEALADKEISVVLAATYSLFLLKDKTAFNIYYAILMRDKKSSEGMIQAQLDRLKDPKQMAELGVQEGLGFVPFGGMGFEAYRQLSKRNESPVRAAAARFLANDPDLVSQDALLQSALADDSDNVRNAALDALAERGNPGCIERLLKNLDENKSDIRYRTAAVIIHLSSVKKPRAKK
jgi:HEAT repeat protein